MARQVDRTLDDTKRLRREAGAYIKELRLKKEMTQRELAALLGLDYYTFISQIENGQGSVPSHLYEQFARVLGVDQKQFVKHMMRYYDPFTYKILWGIDGKGTL